LPLLAPEGSRAHTDEAERRFRSKPIGQSDPS
jgi:hypothetical protein